MLFVGVVTFPPKRSGDNMEGGYAVCGCGYLSS